MDSPGPCQRASTEPPGVPASPVVVRVFRPGRLRSVTWASRGGAQSLPEVLLGSSKRMTTDLLAGVLLVSAVESRGTRTLVSG